MWEAQLDSVWLTCLWLVVWVDESGRRAQSWLCRLQRRQWGSRPLSSYTAPSWHWTPLDRLCPALGTHMDTSFHRKMKRSLKKAFAFPLTIQNGPLAIDLCVFEVRVLYRRVVVWHKDLLKKLDGQGALPDATIPHHHQLVRRQVVTGHCAGRHGCSFSGPKGGKWARGGLVRHTWLRWRKERDAERNENGSTIERGGDTDEQGLFHHHGDHRPQAPKKKREARESSVPFQISIQTNTHSRLAVIYSQRI